MWNVLHVAFTTILYSDVASDFFTDGDDDDDDEDDEDNEEDNGDFSFSDMGSDDDDDEDDGDDIDDDALFELLWSSYVCGKLNQFHQQIFYFIPIFIMNTE